MLVTYILMHCSKYFTYADMAHIVRYYIYIHFLANSLYNKLKKVSANFCLIYNFIFQGNNWQL